MQLQIWYHNMCSIRAQINRRTLNIMWIITTKIKYTCIFSDQHVDDMLQLIICHSFWTVYRVQCARWRMGETVQRLTNLIAKYNDLFKMDGQGQGSNVGAWFKGFVWHSAQVMVHYTHSSKIPKISQSLSLLWFLMDWLYFYYWETLSYHIIWRERQADKLPQLV